MTKYEKRRTMNECAMKLHEFKKKAVKELKEKGLSNKEISLTLDCSETFIINVLNGGVKVIRKS